MPKIVVQNLFNKEIFIEDEGKNVLEAIHQFGIDWMHACGAKGRCTTCKAVVLQDEGNFSELSLVEIKFRSQGKLKDNERLMCQCRVIGDVMIKVADENKFMHMDYSD
ncbi:MAG: (2Fe-2S)-binding protein [Reichenbachiella sp.]